MFTTTVAGLAFIVTSFFLGVFFAFELIEFFRDSKLKRAEKEIHLALHGTYPVTDWTKLSIMLAIWFASGWYLFG